MAPTDRKILEDPRYVSCRQKYPINWSKCEELQRTYTTFSPTLYSLELIIPILGQQQSKDWAPQLTLPCAEIGWGGLCIRPLAGQPADPGVMPQIGYSVLGILISIFTRLETLIGWLAGLMFVAVASGFVKKD